MKILLLVLLCFALLPFSQAHSEGLYFSGNIGGSILQDADNKGAGTVLTSSHDTGVTTGASVGYQANKNLRGELEFSYKQFGMDKLTITQSSFPSINGIGAKANGDVKLFNFLANVFYDFTNRSLVTPYLVGGIGVSSIALDNVTVLGTLVADDTTTAFAYQVGAGLAFNMSELIDLTLDYRLMGTSDPEFQDDTGAKFNSEILTHNIGVGVRFYLSAKPKSASFSPSSPKSIKAMKSQIKDVEQNGKAEMSIGDGSKKLGQSTKLLISKKECAFVTDSPYSPPYSIGFINCMKELGWSPKN